MRDRRLRNFQTMQDTGKKMATGNDMKAHKGTYSGFVTLFKWSAITAALITFVVVLLIAS